jgi:hypothetical protein
MVNTFVSGTGLDNFMNTETHKCDLEMHVKNSGSYD